MAHLGSAAPKLYFHGCLLDLRNNIHPGGSDGKASVCSAGDPSSIPGLGRSPGGGNGNPLQYSCLENSHGRRSLVGYSPWGRRESDTTEQLHFYFPHSTCQNTTHSTKKKKKKSDQDIFFCPLSLPQKLSCPLNVSKASSDVYYIFPWGHTSQTPLKKAQRPHATGGLELEATWGRSRPLNTQTFSDRRGAPER